MPVSAQHPAWHVENTRPCWLVLSLNKGLTAAQEVVLKLPSLGQSNFPPEAPSKAPSLPSLSLFSS